MIRVKKALILGLASIGIVASSSASATIITDVLWVVDTSSSMGGDIDEVKNRISEFNVAMRAADIDAHYGLVEFGGLETLVQDIADFSTFTRSGGPFDVLTDDGGGTERGSAGVLAGFQGANFRQDAIINVILITDEDDDSSAAQRNAAIVALIQRNALVNVIGNPSDQDIPRKTDGLTYEEFADSYDGAFFDILDFRNNPEAFFTNFTQTKVEETIDRNAASVPAPSTLLLLGTGLVGAGIARRRMRT